MYYRTCKHCGSNLDPGEKCDCQKDKINKMNHLMSLFKDDADGQISMKVEDFEYAGNQCIS